MMHPSTELRLVDPRVGYGVVATAALPKGTIVWARDEFDITFPPARAAQFGPPYSAILEKYAYLDGNGEVLLCWDHGRFVNHSCEANCLSAGWPDFEVAIRDIRAGEQITDDYGTLNLDGDFDCLCGSSRCRGRVRRDDVLKMAEPWDELVMPAIRCIGDVPQPLRAIVRSSAALERALKGELPIPSIRENYRTR